MGEFSHYYHASPNEVMKMEATRFFVMLEAKRVLEARDRALQCWISRASSLPTDLFNELVSWFDGPAGSKKRPTQVPDHIEQNSDHSTYKMEAGSVAANNAVLACFRMDTRINRDATH